MKTFEVVCVYIIGGEQMSKICGIKPYRLWFQLAIP